MALLLLLAACRLQVPVSHPAEARQHGCGVLPERQAVIAAQGTATRASGTTAAHGRYCALNGGC